MQLRPLGPLSDNRFWQFGGAVGGAMVVPWWCRGGAVVVPFVVPFMIYFRLWYRFVIHFRLWHRVCRAGG
jgi:hypothetical protein